MKRRGNKSNKVPNVKLRPAEKGAYSSHPVVESCWAQDSQAPADDSAPVLDTCPRPLVNVVLCATGITDKPTLFKQAVELGATCTLAFTDRVTHLIAVDHGGAKYMCALERKIPIVKPSWITDNYQIWLRGDDVNVPESITTHRLPIFSGVVVCPSGITDITRRTQIAKLIAAHDGAYLKNLERPVRVTHLLCSGDTETDKMRYADKFNARGEASIQMVWEEWFWDSLDFGGRFEEKGYQVRSPRPERRTMPVGAPPGPPTSSLPSRFDDEGPSSSAPRPAPGPPQRANVPQNQNQNPSGVDDTDEEPAFAKVLPNVTLQLWGNLLGRRGYQVADGEIILSPSKVADTDKAKAPGRPHPHPSPPSPQPQTAFGAARSLISSVRRANSFAPQETSTAARQVPFRRTATTGAVVVQAVAGPSRLPPPATGAAGVTTIPEHNRASTSKSALAVTGAGPVTAGATTTTTNMNTTTSAGVEPQIFAGLRIRLMGEARGASVRSAIEARGGVVVGGDGAEDGWDDVDYIVVRLVSGSKLFLLEDDPLLRAKYRTECWLEQCLYEDRVCLPSEHVAFVPLGIPTPVPGAERVVFSFSGFEQGAGHALKRLVRALGITLAPTFNRRATHLLCPAGAGLKFDKAGEWGVPVVHMGWLETMARTGAVPGVQGFLVVGPPAEGEPGGGDVGGGVREGDDDGVRRRQDKGKARAAAVDLDEPAASAGFGLGNGKRIVDITNDVPDQPAAKKQRPKQQQQQGPSLGREATTIVPDLQHDPGSGGSRSMVKRTRTASTYNDDTNSGYYIHPSSIPTQSRRPSVPSAGHEDSEQPHHDMFVPDRSFSLHNPLQQQRDEESQREMEMEKSNPHFRIPSSKSPSPMKLRVPGAIPGGSGGGAGAGSIQDIAQNQNQNQQQNQNQNQNQNRPMRRTTSRNMSLSPVKIDHEATKALQESITSLLGKRASPDGEDVMPNNNPNANANGRGAKRARPQRSKTYPSRQVSDANIDAAGGAGAGVGVGMGAGAKDKGVTTRKAAAEYTSAIGAFEPYDEHGHAHGGIGSVGGTGGERSQAEEESMRVLYEDPGQRLEKQRLMDLLKSQNAAGEEGEDSMALSGSGSGSGSGSYTRKSTRRSTRIAG